MEHPIALTSRLTLHASRPWRRRGRSVPLNSAAGASARTLDDVSRNGENRHEATAHRVRLTTKPQAVASLSTPPAEDPDDHGLVRRGARPGGVRRASPVPAHHLRPGVGNPRPVHLPARPHNRAGRRADRAASALLPRCLRARHRRGRGHRPWRRRRGPAPLPGPAAALALRTGLVRVPGSRHSPGVPRRRRVEGQSVRGAVSLALAAGAAGGHATVGPATQTPSRQARRKRRGAGSTADHGPYFAKDRGITQSAPCGRPGRAGVQRGNREAT